MFNCVSGKKIYQIKIDDAIKCPNKTVANQTNQSRNGIITPIRTHSIKKQYNIL